MSEDFIQDLPPERRFLPFSCSRKAPKSSGVILEGYHIRYVLLVISLKNLFPIFNHRILTSLIPVMHLRKTILSQAPAVNRLLHNVVEGNSWLSISIANPTFVFTSKRNKTYQIFSRSFCYEAGTRAHSDIACDSRQLWLCPVFIGTKRTCHWYPELSR